MAHYLSPMKSLLIPLMLFLLITGIAACKQENTLKANHTKQQRQVDQLIAKALNYQTMSDYSLSSYVGKLENIVRDTKNSTALVYSALFKAQLYWHAGNHKASMEVAMQGLAAAEQRHILKPIPSFYSVIANLHKENANYPLAFDAQEKGYRYAKQIKDTTAMIRMISNKAMFIHSARLRYNTPPEQDSSIRVHFRGLSLAQTKESYRILRIPFYNNIAQYYKDAGNYKQAISYAEKAVAIARDEHQYRSLTYSYAWLGQSWYALGDRAKGFDFLTQALQISRDLKQPYREMELISDLYQMHYASGDYKAALDFNIRGQQIHDSLQVQLNEKQISELQIKYESAQKDKQLFQLDAEHKKQDLKLFIVFAGALILLLMLILLLYRYRVVRNTNRIIHQSNTDKSVALEHIAVIQAHDLRKPLASILGLVHVIKSMGDEVDPECLHNLEMAGKELDAAVHAVISTVEAAERNI